MIASLQIGNLAIFSILATFNFGYFQIWQFLIVAIQQLSNFQKFKVSFHFIGCFGAIIEVFLINKIFHK